jgi:hypothetical protein
MDDVVTSASEDQIGTVARPHIVGASAGADGVEPPFPENRVSAIACNDDVTSRRPDDSIRAGSANDRRTLEAAFLCVGYGGRYESRHAEGD